MAAEDFKKRSDIDRRRQREDEADDEFEKGKRPPGVMRGGQESVLPGPVDSTEKLKQLIDRVEPVIEQVNTLYQQYLTGVERLPPIERRKQLEQMMEAITVAPKATAAVRFLANGIASRFLTYRDRWDRLLRDLEAGKIKRQTKR